MASAEVTAIGQGGPSHLRPLSGASEVSGGCERLCGEFMSESRFGSMPHHRLMNPAHPPPHTAMSDDQDDLSKDGYPTHIPTPDQSSGSWSFGAVLSVLGAIMLAFILRLAVPKEDNAIELGVLLIAVGFAQIWLIFNFLKSFRK